MSRKTTAAALLSVILLAGLATANEISPAASSQRRVAARTTGPAGAEYAGAGYYGGFDRGAVCEQCQGACEQCQGACGADCGPTWAPSCYDDPWARYGHVWNGYCQERACRESLWQD